MLEMFVRHVRDDHGMEFQIASDGTRFIEQDIFRVELGVQPEGLRVRLAGPNESALVFFREEIVHHVADLDTVAADAMRWDDESGWQEGQLPPNFHLLTVKHSNLLFEGMQRVTLSCPTIANTTQEGIHLRLMMPQDVTRTPIWPHMAANGAPVWPQGDDKLHARFVTVRQCRPEAGEIDIDIVRHDTGLISQFAQSAHEGQVVGGMGPAGMNHLPQHDTYLLTADGTGLPAVARLLETLPDTAKGDVIVALPEGVDYLPQSPLTLHRVAPDRFETEILSMVKERAAQTPIAYGFFAGEFENAQEIRKFFKGGLGLDKSTQISTAYWRRGNPGFGS
ncbi:MAG: siderophore-interacting protein [Pseudomonadota bacterium]